MPLTGTPSILTSPLSGSTSRLMNLSVVVLPEPEVPTTATKLPAATAKGDVADRETASAIEGLGGLVDLDQCRICRARM